MVNALGQYANNTFSSLRIRNYRLYYTGQIISTSGTFMQSVAQAWLVLQLSNSGTALGLVMALQYIPVLLLAPYGGVIADRFSKRKLLFFTQSAFGILAVGLGILVLTGSVRLWMVDVFAFCYGLINTIDNPTRQSFVVEMVGEEHLRNAVTLYSSLVNLARVIGPSIAGVLIATIALAPCFILNGLSYGAVVIMLAYMRAGELKTPSPAPRTGGQLRAGLRYVASTPVLRNVLLMLAIIGTLTFEFQVSLPLIAEFTFHGDARSYAALLSGMGIGAVVGGLITAGQKRISTRLLVIAAFLFGLTTLAASAMPTLVLAALAMVLVGVCSINFTSLGNSILQLESAPDMRGRVMALWSVAFLGSTAIGGPIIGWIGENTDARWGLAVGGFAALIAAVLGLVTLRHTFAPGSNRMPGAAHQAQRTAHLDDAAPAARKGPLEKMPDDRAEISRVTRTREQTRSTYDRISRWYDPLEGSWEGKPKQVGLQKLGAKRGEVVLEIGFGTGHGILALAQAVGECGRVYGIDLSPRMLALAQTRVNRKGLAERVCLQNGDAAALPFASDFFDAIFASFVLELFDTPEIPQVLTECRRVLKGGGRLCVVALSKTGRSTWMQKLYEWGHDRFPMVVDCRPIFVQKALESVGLDTREASRMSLWGLAVEIVVGGKPTAAL